MKIAMPSITWGLVIDTHRDRHEVLQDDVRIIGIFRLFEGEHRQYK